MTGLALSNFRGAPHAYTGDVLYRGRPSHRAGPDGGEARWDVLEFLAQVLDHIPEPSSSPDTWCAIGASTRMRPAANAARPHRRETPPRRRAGTTTLFAALNLLEGTVIAQCMPRHRHQEFLRLLKRLDRETPQRFDVHLVLDNHQTHKHSSVRRWLKDHTRFHFHFIPTSSSWLNLVERWLAELTNKAIRRGAFPSVRSLVQAIRDYVKHNNKNSEPFVWTASAQDIIRKVNRGKAKLETLH